MKDELLLKYIKDEYSPQEEIDVLDWVSEDSKNLKKFVEFKNLWISQTIPQNRAEKNDYLNFKENVKSEKRKITAKYLRYSIAASIIVLLGLNLHFNFLKKDDTGVIALQGNGVIAEGSHMNHLYTDKGVKAKITLPDGSKVWLNSDSRIIYPNSFSEKSREIQFAGEAYFDVIGDSLRPMIIHTNKNFRAEVFGTSFNIKSYDNDDNAQTTLYTGSLRLVAKVGKKEVISIMKPNETVIIKDDASRVKEEKEEPQKESAWKEGDLIFNATPLSEAIKMLERWHGTTFIVQNPQFLKGRITATFHSESIIQIMELLKYSLKIEYKVENNQVTIF